MFKGLVVTAALALVPVAAGQVAVAQGRNNQNKNEKVTICHRTNSAKNPYVKITVNVSAVDGAGKNDHSHHTGPVFDPTVHDQRNRGWGDIIPPVNGQTGLNWTAKGQAILENGCKPVDSEEPENVQVCNPITGALITVPEAQADDYKPADDEACKDKPKVPVVPLQPEKPTTPGQTLSTSTTAQVEAPVGAVAAGTGSSIAASLYGLGASLTALSLGALRLMRRN